MAATAKWSEMLNFIWTIRDKDLRFYYERSEVGDVVLPLVVLRRLDAVLAPTKAKVLKKAASLTGSPDDSADLLAHVAGQSFYNVSKFDFPTLVSQDPDNIRDNVLDYLNGFSPNVREIIAKFGFVSHVEKMDEVGILLRVLGKFASSSLDLSPENVSNLDMGYLYEDLLRLVSDLSNKEAGDHFTPREVISLMVHLLVTDTEDLHTVGKVLTCYDPACGTGGMLTETEKQLLTINPKARVYLFGQEINPKSHAVCTSDMLIKGQDATNIKRLDTLAHDGFPDRRFEYVIANPPYGVDWSESMDEVKREHARGFAGRFGAGLPGKGDGQLLFVQHMVAKAKTADEGGGRVAVVLNGSPLFSGDAGSGESNIRKWLFENDLVEAIIGLPDQLFYNTGINTYVWVLATKKRPERQGLVQLIDARDLYSKMSKSLGDKRNEFTQSHISEIVRIYESFTNNERSKIMRNEEFGYTKITIERPLRLRYELTSATLERLRSDKVLTKLSPAVHAAILDVLATAAPWTGETRLETDAAVASWLTEVGKTSKAVRDSLIAALSVKDPHGEPLVDAKTGGAVPDAALRDTEYVPLTASMDDFVKSRVLAFYPNAWRNAAADKIGYEIPFTRCFYRYVPPRLLGEIDEQIRERIEHVVKLIAAVAP